MSENRRTLSVQIVSITAYLIGVSEDMFRREFLDLCLSQPRTEAGSQNHTLTLRHPKRADPAIGAA